MARRASGRWIITKRPCGASSASEAPSQSPSGASPSARIWARARADLGEARTVPGAKKGGLVTTSAAAPSPRPASRRAAGSADVASEDARSGAKAILGRVALGERGERGIDFDEVGAGCGGKRQDGEADRPDPGADVDDLAIHDAGRGGEQGRVGADAMPPQAPRPAACSRIDRHGPAGTTADAAQDGDRTEPLLDIDVQRTGHSDRAEKECNENHQ